MSSSTATLAPASGAATEMEFDFKNAVSDNRLIGLWHIMTGFRLRYMGATLSLGLMAIFRTASLFLLRFLIDDVLARDEPGGMLPLVALGFFGLALLQGTFAFLSGRLAAQTAEGVAQRLRNYLFDHIQRLTFTYHDHAKTG